MKGKSKLELISEIAQASNKNLELIQEINQLETNWDNLKKWLKEVNTFQRHMCDIKENHITLIEAILEKINEIESEATNE